jgi:hypothetical protein
MTVLSFWVFLQSHPAMGQPGTVVPPSPLTLSPGEREKHWTVLRAQNDGLGKQVVLVEDGYLFFDLSRQGGDRECAECACVTS